MQDKKNQKEKDKQVAKEQLRAENSGPTARDIELDQLNAKLKTVNCTIKNIPADGNCLYRLVMTFDYIVSHGSPGRLLINCSLSDLALRRHSNSCVPLLPSTFATMLTTSLPFLACYLLIQSLTSTARRSSQRLLQSGVGSLKSRPCVLVYCLRFASTQPLRQKY